MTIKYYLVTLEVGIGEFEKIIKKTVAATDGHEAGYLACYNETHYEPLTEGEYENGDDWWDGEMLYNVKTVREVTEAFHTEFHKV